MDPEELKIEMAAAEHKTQQSLNFIEFKLQCGNHFLVPGLNKPTLADVTAYCDIAQMKFIRGFEETYLGPHQKLNEWFNRMGEVPEIKESHAILFKLIEKSHKKDS